MDKKSKTNKLFLFLFVVVLILTLKFLVHFVLYEDITNINKPNSNLNKDGYEIIQNIFTEKEIIYLKNLCDNEKFKEVKHFLMYNKKINNYIINHTNKDYVFQDYIFIIKRSAIHTCHRDSNGDFFNENQKHPSFTILFFLEDMEKCLGVIPKSHFDINSFNYNPEDQVVNLLCNKGDAIIFNANLIHVGALNNKDDNLRIQMKITHKDDIKELSFYNNYNKILDEDNNMPFFLRKAQRKLSCMFPVVSNFTQTDIQKQARGEEVGVGQKIFSYLFYGNSNFYELPNAY